MRRNCSRWAPVCRCISFRPCGKCKNASPALKTMCILAIFFIGNDPYDGGTHLNDVLIFMPVFEDGGLVAFAANRFPLVRRRRHGARQPIRQQS